MVTMTESTTETSAGLMRLAADGDELAFAGLVGRPPRGGDGRRPDH
jgi:hypothetical protein